MGTRRMEEVLAPYDVPVLSIRNVIRRIGRQQEPSFPLLLLGILDTNEEHALVKLDVFAQALFVAVV